MRLPIQVYELVNKGTQLYVRLRLFTTIFFLQEFVYLFVYVQIQHLVCQKFVYQSLPYEFVCEKFVFKKSVYQQVNN